MSTEYIPVDVGPCGTEAEPIEDPTAPGEYCAEVTVTVEMDQPVIDEPADPTGEYSEPPPGDVPPGDMSQEPPIDPPDPWPPTALSAEATAAPSDQATPSSVGSTAAARAARVWVQLWVVKKRPNPQPGQKKYLYRLIGGGWVTIRPGQKSGSRSFRIRNLEALRPFATASGRVKVFITAHGLRKPNDHPAHNSGRPLWIKLP